jgi:cobalt-zinc-cadmium efflux system outer membrane protein
MKSHIRMHVQPRYAIVLALLLAAAPLRAQQTPGLTLQRARELARQTSPHISAAQAAVATAAARERQARAFVNPNITYSREQTSGDGVSTSQTIATFDQRLEIGGQRGARVNAARLRHEAARARLEVALRDLDFEVARAYIGVSTAARRAELASRGAQQFTQASRIMTQRFEQGDVSGYEVRRVRLEAARYAARAAEESLAAREARLRFNQLVGLTSDTALVALQALDRDFDAEPATDSLIAVALLQTAELRAAELDVRAAEAEATSVSREVVPSPTLSAGFKNELTTADERLSGFVAAVSLPLPLWDRRGGAADAARAEARRLEAEREAARRRVQRTVEMTVEAVRAADRQQAALRAQLGPEAEAALQAAEVAFAEGEITLLEWLDAVRAYQEAEAAFANVLAESYTQRAALERLLAVPLIQ